MTEEDSSVFDFLNAPLGLLEDGTTKTFGHVLNSTELAEGSADGTLDGGGEALKDKVAVGVPGKGSILEEKVLVDGVLMGFSDTLPDAVLRSDEGTGEENGDGIDGVVHVDEVAHLTFGDDFGLLNTTAVSKGLDKAGIKLGKHAKKVVFRADFLGDATGEENGADGLATVPLEPPQDSTVSELGDGGGLGEHALGHAFNLIDGEHFELVDTLLEHLLFFGNGRGAPQFVDGGEVLLFSPDLQRDDLAVWTGGLDGLATAVANELACSTGAFEAIDGVEGEDEGVHGIGGALTTRKDMVTVDGLTANIPVIERFAGVGTSIVQIRGNAHLLYKANGNGGRVAVENFCRSLCSF